MKYKISPSLMCMDLLNIEKQIKILNKYVYGYHVDILDGVYLKNFSFTPPFLREIRKITDKILDVHLMICDPVYYLDEIIDCGADYVSIHTEKLLNEAFRIGATLHKNKRKLGVVISPETPVEAIFPYIDIVDKVTVMTISPGWHGAPYIPQTTKKIQELVDLRKEKGYSYLIDFDGGDAKYYRDFKNAGTDIYIVGRTGLFNLDEDLDKAAQKSLAHIENC